MQEKTIVIATYIDCHTPYSFPIKIVKRIKLTVPALAIKYPKKESIKKVQRRKHVRVQTAIDVAVHSPKNVFSPFTTVTFDISGGGISVILPSNKTLESVNIVHIWLVLHMSSGEHRYINSESKLIRIKSLEHNREYASLQFTSLEPKAKQTIIQYCFEKQREARQKGLI